MLANTMSVLLVSQSCLMMAAHEARLVRRSVSATGDIIPESAAFWAGNDGNDNMDNELLRAYSLVDVEGKSAQDMLSEVESMFENEALNVEDGDKINIIKKLVNDELLPNLLKTRNAAQAQINKNLESIGSCNSKSETKQEEVRSKAEKYTKTSRAAHSSCRNEEKNKNNTKNSKCNELDTFLDAISVPSSIPNGRPRGGMVKYVKAMSSYFCPKEPLVTDLAVACANAEKEHAEHRADCNKKQAVFELAFCTWRTALTDACAELNTCYADAVKAWKDHATATNKLVQKWKVEFRALHKINCYTDVWLNDKDHTTVDSDKYAQCKANEKDANEMNVDVGVAPPKIACDLTPVAIYPGTSQFPATEYADFIAYTVSPIPCS